MDKDVSDELVKLYLLLLTSEEGVSEEVFNSLYDVATISYDTELLAIIERIEETDGRYYLPKNEAPK